MIVWSVHVQQWLKVSDCASVWRMMSHASSGRKSWGSRGMTLTVRVVPSVENSGLRVSKWKRTASLAFCSSSVLWQGMEMMTKCFSFIFFILSSETICFCVRLFAKRFHLLKGCWMFSVLEENERKAPILSKQTPKKRKRNALLFSTFQRKWK